MGGSARYRFMKKIDKLQQKYGSMYGNNPDYLRELDKARQAFVEQRQRELEKEVKRKAEQEASKQNNQNSGNETNNNSPYSEKYNQQRLDDAIWTNDKHHVDDKFRDNSGQWWNSLNDDQKEAATHYTGGDYEEMNKLLGGRLDVTDSYYDTAKTYVDNLTDALETAEIPEDIWVRRGVSPRHINRLFGISNLATPITSTPPAEIMKAIADGKILDVSNFMSTSASNDAGFTSSIEMKIFVPKGSKGIYAEPFSTHGDGDGPSWNGVSEQSYYSGEFEIILQRGQKLKPIAYNPNGGINGTHQIVFVIVGQETKPVKIPEIDWSKI